MKNKMLTIALAPMMLVSVAAMATPTYVGSYAVYDGPSWPSNPDVYSAKEAAALIFGGVADDYIVSIFADSISGTGWYDGWGEHSGMVFDDDYKLDLGAPGYNNPGGTGTARSAYVHDGLSDTDTYRNYVWRVDGTADVPEPAALALFGLGVVGLAFTRRRKV